MSSDLDWTPQDFGFSAWSFDPYFQPYNSSGNPSTLNAEKEHIYFSELKADATTINGISVLISNTGSNLVSGHNFIGIYDEQNRLLGKSLDQSEVWGGHGPLWLGPNFPVLAPIETIFLQPGIKKIKVCLLTDNNFGSSPSFNSNESNLKVSMRSGTANTGITELPQILSEVIQTSKSFWCAIN